MLSSENWVFYYGSRGTNGERRAERKRNKSRPEVNQKVTL
jgi:hypothetical protein